MAGWTNRGKACLLGVFFDRTGSAPLTAEPLTFYVALVTNAVVPSVTTNALSELTQVSGTGYTAGGEQLLLSTGFTLSEDDSGNLGSLICDNVAWTAGAGGISNIYYAVLVSDVHYTTGATGAAAANRTVLMWWDLGGPRTIADTQTMTVNGAEVRITE